MTTRARPADHTTASERAGILTLALGIVFTAAVAYTYALSILEGFNPPTWVRIIGLVWIPVGFLGAPLAYTVARTGEGRGRGRRGLVIGLVGLVALVVLLFARG